VHAAALAVRKPPSASLRPPATPLNPASLPPWHRPAQPPTPALAADELFTEEAELPFISLALERPLPSHATALAPTPSATVSFGATAAPGVVRRGAGAAAACGAPEPRRARLVVFASNAGGSRRVGVEVCGTAAAGAGPGPGAAGIAVLEFTGGGSAAGDEARGSGSGAPPIGGDPGSGGAPPIGGGPGGGVYVLRGLMTARRVAGSVGAWLQHLLA
jgi:hypothetical protein